MAEPGIVGPDWTGGMGGLPSWRQLAGRLGGLTAGQRYLEKLKVLCPAVLWG
jgi:hypothetical protein